MAERRPGGCPQLLVASIIYITHPLSVSAEELKLECVLKMQHFPEITIRLSGGAQESSLLTHTAGDPGF